jgi:hypothetical protein
MLTCLLLVPLLATAQQEIPAGTEISIRLSSAVSTTNSQPGDPVEAVVIAPVVLQGYTAIAPGALVHGTVARILKPVNPGGRAELLLAFGGLTIGDKSPTFAARLVSVDNARESVDEHGQINGILASETITGRLDGELGKLSGEYGGLAGILTALKRAAFQEASADIAYSPGVEMTLKLTKSLLLFRDTRFPDPPALPAGDLRVLSRFISREPFRTMTPRPSRPSDIVNLVLVASPDAIGRAFAEAGWRSAASLNPSSGVETLRAVAEDRGYNEAPVSKLLLAGKPPDLVFEKANNTFAQRHHVHIWRRPGRIGGKPVWAVAATHDTGIDFSDRDRTFIHRIDPEVDREREKVIDDLLFAGRVRALGYLERLEVPRETSNATGDRIETDGRLAVLRLN